ncbi:MAG: hypothetical protein GXP45_05655 [bacterium]|nr:hypothetical protein [bacterium]
MGVDIFVRSESSKEADRVKKYNQLRGQTLQHQANAHLTTGIISASSEVVLAGLALA